MLILRLLTLLCLTITAPNFFLSQPSVGRGPPLMAEAMMQPLFVCSKVQYIVG